MQQTELTCVNLKDGSLEKVPFIHEEDREFFLENDIELSGKYLNGIIYLYARKRGCSAANAVVVIVDSTDSPERAFQLLREEYQKVHRL